MMPPSSIIGLIVEARKKADRDASISKFKKATKLPKAKWTRESIAAQADPTFINHALHVERLMKGGTVNGRSFPGGGGVSWGGLVVLENQALLRVKGSFEYGPTQEIYQTTLSLKDFKRVAEANDLSWPDKAHYLINESGMKVQCDCKAWKYYHAHSATVKGFALVPENIAAPINNPENKGGICKHLAVTLQWLGAQAPQMASEMKTWYESKGRSKPKKRSD